jgi:hypothetical protein
LTNSAFSWKFAKEGSKVWPPDLWCEQGYPVTLVANITKGQNPRREAWLNLQRADLGTRYQIDPDTEKLEELPASDKE